MALLMSPLARTQYAALTRMRLQMLVNSLRSKRASFDLAARIIRITFFLVVGLVIGTGLGVSAFQITKDNELRLLPLLFWPVMMLWQLAPVVLASFQEPVDLTLLLRFPVSFGSYVLDYLVFGLFDASSILGGFCLVGICAGMVWARPELAGWAAVMAILFAAFNVSADADGLCVARSLAGAEEDTGSLGHGLPVPHTGSAGAESGAVCKAWTTVAADVNGDAARCPRGEPRAEGVASGTGVTGHR